MLIFKCEDPRWLSNAYLVSDEAGGSAVVIDTGAPTAPIVDEARRLGVRVAMILNTHFHGDHIAGNQELAGIFGAPVCAHRIEAPRIPSATVRLEDRQRPGLRD